MSNDSERLLQSCVQNDANPDWNTAVLTIIRSTRNQSRFIDVRFPLGANRMKASRFARFVPIATASVIHSITTSARASNDGAMVSASVRAAW
jgi:hypothetical protein